jgi:hypothetical protein
MRNGVTEMQKWGAVLNIFSIHLSEFDYRILIILFGGLS